MNKKQINELKETFEKELKEQEYELVDIEYVHEDGMNWLRFFIYSKDGITSDNIDKASKYISQRLDELDPIREQYYLEVSSPDLNRPLKTDRDLERNIGEKINLHFFKKIDGTKEIEGILERFESDKIYLSVNDEILEYNRSDISQIKPAIF